LSDGDESYIISMSAPRRSLPAAKQAANEPVASSDVLEVTSASRGIDHVAQDVLAKRGLAEGPTPRPWPS